MEALCAVAPRSLEDPASCARAADGIAQAFAGTGLTVQRQPYRALGADYVNVLARVGPPSASPFVLGAHYDAVPGTPGADDNASGIAVLLELARLLGRKLPQDVLLAAFCTEEVTGTDAKGSFALAKDLPSVRGMLSLEMVGYFSEVPGSQRFPLPGLGACYPRRGDFLAVVSDFGAWHFSARLARALRRAGGVPVRTFCGPASMPGIHWSDHASFRRLGVPAAMLTDTAFHRNPHYHRHTDIPDTLDYARMAEAARMLAGVLSAGRFPLA